MTPWKLYALLAVAAALLFAACGGSDDETETAQVPGGADPAVVDVIAGWAKAESSGDDEAAAEYFAIPSLAVNGCLLYTSDAADE